jgi:hypothetical protein
MCGVLGAFLCGHLSDFRAYWVCSRLLEMADFRVPLAKRGEPKGGGNYELWLHSWYNG